MLLLSLGGGFGVSAGSCVLGFGILNVFCLCCIWVGVFDVWLWLFFGLGLVLGFWFWVGFVVLCDILVYRWCFVGWWFVWVFCWILLDCFVCLLRGWLVDCDVGGGCCFAAGCLLCCGFIVWLLIFRWWLMCCLLFWCLF